MSRVTEVFRREGDESSSDFVLLLIVGEATQPALLGDAFSVMNAIIVIVTLVGIDTLLSLIKQRSQRIERLMDSLPIILVEHGKLLQDRMDKVRVDEAEILSAGRELRGLERLDQIKYAVLEASGNFSIIPNDEEKVEWENEKKKERERRVKERENGR